MVKPLSFLLVIALLLVRESTLDWQSEGNMTSDNMTVIKNYIQANLTLSWINYQLTSKTYFLLADFSQAFSKELNRRWDQAWNVFVIYYENKLYYDAVVYGYAFRDHWHWYNAIKFNDGYYASIVLWKDYNCKKWWSYAKNRDPQTSYSSDPDDLSSTAINPVYLPKVETNFLGTNVWQVIHDIGSAFETDSRTKDYAFTILGCWGRSSQINGHFCAENYMQGNYLGVDDQDYNYWGRTFILQMR